MDASAGTMRSRQRLPRNIIVKEIAMSSTTSSAATPVIGPNEGHPIDPDVIVPDGDASLHEDEPAQTERPGTTGDDASDGGRSSVPSGS